MEGLSSRCFVGLAVVPLQGERSDHVSRFEALLPGLRNVGNRMAQVVVVNYVMGNNGPLMPIGEATSSATKILEPVLTVSSSKLSVLDRYEKVGDKERRQLISKRIVLHYERHLTLIRNSFFCPGRRKLKENVGNDFVDLDDSGDLNHGLFTLSDKIPTTLCRQKGPTIIRIFNRRVITRDRERLFSAEGMLHGGVGGGSEG
ncbi:hypothetical protein V1477_019288 [Vespula maculifrons]|uniref:Uncharacterized protein n=1 Tax=Vespula maculifrons TaxID=7453 RepID=A0ABD2AS36_VESMC